MKINVISVSVKNFLSYGNSHNVYNFEKGIDIIVAPNGAGKSSITLDALLFGFYGKPYRKIKLSSLQNNINTKEMEVKILLEKNNEYYSIERGLNPSFFRIYKNDNLIDEYANVKDYQKMLEESILETSEKTFRNLIVLGGIGITSGFMDLSASEKEELVSNIIDIKLVNKLLEKLKEKTQALKTQKTELSYKNDFLSNILKNDVERLKSLQANSNETADDNSSLIKKLEVELETLAETKEQYYSLKESMSKLNETEVKLQRKLNSISNQIEVFNNSNFRCKKCGEENNTSEYDIETLLESKIKVEEALSKLSIKKETIAANFTEFNTKMSDLESKNKLLNTLLENQKSRPNISDEFITTLKADILKKKEDLKVIREELNAIINELNKYLEMSDLLGKNNIKKFIINQQIPFLNREINEFLQLFFTNYSFYFDSSLKDKVFYKNTEQDYHQLSNGQKIRICFSIMFAFIRFLEQKNGTQWNILVLDEILDSSLDMSGVESLLGVIRKEFSNKNIVLVSHNDEIKNMDIFSRKVTISRNRFSSINFENLKDSLSKI